MDVAFMLHWRQVRQADLRQGGCARYLMVDSSPQGGRDYELIVECVIKQEALARCFKRATDLAHLWQTAP